MKILYLFTVKFPFTLSTECFLEEEILYLAKGFDRIVVIPLQKEVKTKKKLPDNCIIIQPIMDNRSIAFFKGLFNFSVVKKLIPEFFKNRVLYDRVKMINWIKAYYIGNNMLNSCQLKSIEKNLKCEDVCYFYWGKWSNLMSVFWKDKCRMVSRFHGEYDLWENVHHNYVPLRNLVAKSLNCAFFISLKGMSYFNGKYPECKSVYSPLGSKSINYFPRERSSNLRILSCSNVIPLKRVHLIFQSLLEIKDQPISWIHIGGGSGFEDLKEFVGQHSNRNIEVTLKGAMNHEEVVDFYENNTADVFVNLSTIEGVPVSIMEAISCDIPVVATDVGGTCEVVTDETGVLVNANPTPSEVASAILLLHSKELSPRSFWESHFDANKNYQKFVEYLREG